ncbi:MAG TPA: toll/interleukin-1 receptor domain-containing protein [Nocardioides sp.]|uniref:toll/interleukin-1 receptor domain-containing protein n=1 Tax=Nocardioides sp. TaxID=35761 RepID=UPI002E33F4D8|nr:toll/interleukin-1 receptor domain-containing protein [Nocardioides sp.]HEX5086881.1 toll/interleukin-1 receptor domain-containing protein [Nocardioides sp.]
MARLFISYARRDMPVVAQLVNELREMGHEPFYDQDLTGGQRWWDVLLTRIEESDGFLPVLSDAYVDSEACRQEAHWASDVGVPILPLDLGSVGPEMCDPHVAQTNWIRYGLEDRTSIARLARALGALQARTPPAEPPARPPVPVTYLTATRQEIHDAETMPVDRQLAIIATLRTKLGTDDDATARTLLAELRRRPDVAYASAVEIDHMLGSAAPPHPPAPKGGDGRSRRLLVVAAAAVAVLVIAGGTSWVVTHLGGDDDKGGGGGPAAGTAPGESPATSAAPASSSETDALVAILDRVDESAQHPPLVPPGSCAVTRADAVHCEPGVSGVASVDFVVYDSLDDLYEAYTSQAETSAGMPFDRVMNTGECDSKHFSGEVSWNHNRNHSRKYSVEQLMHGGLNAGSQAAGRVFCGLHGSALTMIWTQNDGPRFVAVAQGAPHDKVGAWWRQVHHEIACLGMSDMPGACDEGGGGSSTPEPSDGMTEPSDGMTDGMG